MLGMLAGAALRSLLLAAVVGATLRLRRSYNPRVSLTAWTLVLAASLSMPMASRLASIVLPHGMIEVAKLPLIPELVTRTEIASVMSRAEQVDLYWLVLFIYLAVSGALMLRMLLGLSLSWVLVRRATPIREDWIGGFEVRVSRLIDAPATFGSVILLPSDYVVWRTAKRVAVLAHEGSHVARCDFAIQLAAAVNRVVFWFNPFTWWLQAHLSDLAEAASDDAAIASLDDRFGYAEILLELSGRVPGLPGAVAMARRSAVAQRIERILSEPPLQEGMSRCGRTMMAGCIVPLTILLSAIIVSPAPPDGPGVLPVANVTDNETVATGVKRSTAAYTLAIVVPVMAFPPPLATEVVAAAELPSARDSEAQIPLQPVRLSLSSGRGPSRRASPSNKVTSDPPRLVVDSAKAPSRASIAEDPAIKGVGEDSQPAFFERLVNATCAATDILRLGPAYLTRDGPAYLAQARFFRSRDGKPWVTLSYSGGQAANLPVMIVGSEIKFTRSYDMMYTLSPSQNNHLVSFAKHPDGGTVDFACRGNAHPS